MASTVLTFVLIYHHGVVHREEERFKITRLIKAPGPPPTWDGIFEANSDHIECLQLNGTEIIGYEDCLVLNVYVPIEPLGLLPVLVYIHGGGFYEGSGSRRNAGPQFLVEKGIIVVTMNYRLGAFVFLCLGVKEAPGNIALKDQHAALEWVNRNIRSLGGDPSRVSISGQSAGAASVSFQVLSSRSSGLFQRAITQSGSATHGWAVNIDPVKEAKSLTEIMGYETATIEETLEVLLTANPHDIITHSRDLSTFLSACLEQEIDGEQPFLTDYPYNIIVSGKYVAVPMINGFTDQEGLMIVDTLDSALLHQNLEMFMPLDLSFSSDSEKSSVAQDVLSFYFGDTPAADLELQAIVDLVSDIWLIHWCRTYTSLHMKMSPFPVYSYLFQYDGGRNYHKQSLQNVHQMPGADHADEPGYLFEPELLTPAIAAPDQLIVDRMTTMWTNFVIYGDPTPVPAASASLQVRWLPSNVTHDNFLVIDSTMGHLEQPYRQRMEFWSDIYEKHHMHRERERVDGNTGISVQANIIVIGLAITVALKSR